MIPIQSGEEGVARLEHGLKKIVRTVDPEDGKEYVTYFTKHSICCKWMEGDNEVSWTMDITEEQYAYKVILIYVQKVLNKNVHML